MITCGSLFAGIGGFELGAQYAFDAAGIDHRVLWQVEQDKFCQSILQKHWPHARIFDDVREVGAHNLDPVDVLMGGFPCQDISVAGNMRGLDGKRSGLWWEMWRIIGELRPRIIVLENVANVVRLGGREVLGSLAKIGYDAEWCVISAKSQGAPHKRARWFCVAYPNKLRFLEHKRFKEEVQQSTIQGIQREESQQSILSESPHGSFSHATNPHSESQPNSPNNEEALEGDSSHTNCESSSEWTSIRIDLEQERETQIGHFARFRDMRKDEHNEGRSYWERYAPQSPLCSVDDGIPQRVARLKALGNAIVPQCSQYIFTQIINSGLLS